MRRDDYEWPEIAGRCPCCEVIGPRQVCGRCQTASNDACLQCYNRRTVACQGCAGRGWHQLSGRAYFCRVCGGEGRLERQEGREAA